MDTLLWVVQSMLALAFFTVGATKAFSPQKKLRQIIAAGASVSLAVPRLLGVFEMLGAIGVILPVLLNVFPFLTVVAAICFCIVMTGASILHWRKKDYKPLPVIVLLFIFSVFIAIGRY